MKQAINLRPIVEADEEFLYHLYCSTRAAELAAVRWSEAEREAFLRFQFAAQQTHYRHNLPTARQQIVCQQQSAIGRLIVADEADALQLADVALLPEYQGKGVGSSLIRRLLAEARARARPLRLQVAFDNQRARSLYERLGCRVTGQGSSHYQMEARPR